jgi:2-polyprenyl-3-methyl-5-hydroxy-6-metoxy-1,4-benzoquinol methylase
MSSAKWSHFWKNQNSAFDEVMQISTTYYASKMEKLFDLKPTDSVFDYGCGPGFLVDYLTDRHISVTGADINKSYVEKNKINHPQLSFIHLSPDTHVNKEAFEKQLSGIEFDFVVLLSITQYFENETELDNIINSLRSHMKKRGKLIIADVIDPNSSAIKDAVSLLLHCIKKGRSVVFFKFISYLMFSDYRKLSKSVKLLQLSEQSVRQIAEKNTLSCQKVNGLTLHPSRYNYILTPKDV